ncbi:tyrosyl-DNA phosphodiesterase-domain-containing protein [Peziza echinospora]|nr:tyrosyl-DNA phosphodiesterase-domain-containing protein [Peziza echinospora]
MATSGGSGGGASDSGDSTRPTKTSRISPAISAAKFYAASSGVGRTLKGDVIPAESGSSSEDGSKASPVVVGDGGGERRRINSLGFKRVAEKRTADPEHGDGIKFPNGVVKRTWCQGVPRSGEDISIEEVLQKDGVAMAVLSAFQWNSQWILEKFRLPGTKFVLVMQAKGEDEKSRLTRMFSVLQGVELVFPNMSGQINCMHSKLMLLFHSDYLRIVVPSANLVPYDWGEVGGVMENCVFIIDLPKLDGDPVDESKLTFFAKELVYFCRAKGYPEKVIRALHRIDYSKTEGLAFVHSVGGSHSGDEAWRRTGYPGLGSAVRKLGLGVKGRGLEVDYITSSVGALNKEFLGNMYRAAMGDDGLAELQSRAIGKYFFGAVKSTAAAAAAAAAGTSSSSSAAAAAAAIPPTTWEDVKDRFRVYFPSHETVEKSTGGTNAGGTICFQEKWWNAESFPKGILRDCKNSGEGRGGVLLHSKVLFARRPRGVGGSVQGGKGGKGGRGAAAAVAWAYVGSANLSESAW